MYFSRQEPNPGNVAYTEAVPSQASEMACSVQNGVTSKRSGEAATPVGKKALGKPGNTGLPVENGAGLEA
jgi:hypothetical protein